MRYGIAILLGAWLLLCGACKTAKTHTPTMAESPVLPTSAPIEKNGAPTVGMAINMDGTLWQADSLVIHQMGTFWLVKGSAADGSVFSIMLPQPLATKEYPVTQGGEVSLTYSTSRAKGHVYFAPFSSNNGWVKTTLANGYLSGSLEVTITNSGHNKQCIGTFSLKL